MKVRNIVFSGFAAAILMGTANAATTPFEIASKAYVDAQVRGATSNVGDTIGDMTTLQNGDDSNIESGTDNVVDALNDLDDAIDTKQNEADSNVASDGNYISAGHNVASNLTDLDTHLKETEDIAKAATAREVNGPNGKALIFNETDGGGAKFEHRDGTWSFAGVNDGGANGLAGQIYAIDSGTKTGTRINVTKNGIYYTNGKNNMSYEAMDEIATKRDLNGAMGGSVGDMEDLQKGEGSNIGSDTTNVVDALNDLDDAINLKQDKADSTTGSGTYNYIAPNSSAVATNLGTLDTNLKRVDDAVGSYDATTGTGTGLAGDVAALQNDLNGANGLDARVDALEETVGDSTDGLVKDVADLGDKVGDVSTLTGFETQPTSVVAALNDLQANKLNKPIPNTCSAQSQHCVLHMDNTGALSWVDITVPYMEVSGGSGSEETQTEP